MLSPEHLCGPTDQIEEFIRPWYLNEYIRMTEEEVASSKQSHNTDASLKAPNRPESI